MADTTPSGTQTPGHLWVVGSVSLLWNAVGAMDFTLTQLKNAAYLKDLTPVQLEYFSHIPLWVAIAWGVGTWGSVAGSLLLLVRQRLAVQLFSASFVGMVLTFTHNYLLSEGLKVMDGGVGQVIFSAVIAVIGVLLLVYARAMRQRAVLR